MGSWGTDLGTLLQMLHSLGLIQRKQEEEPGDRPHAREFPGPEAWSGDSSEHEQDQKEVE